MKEWTKEEIERLVPEIELQLRCIACMPKKGVETPSNWTLFSVILQIRLDLESARKDRDELLKLLGHGHDKTGQLMDILLEAISRIEQSKKEQEHG